MVPGSSKLHVYHFHKAVHKFAMKRQVQSVIEISHDPERIKGSYAGFRITIFGRWSTWLKHST